MTSTAKARAIRTMQTHIHALTMDLCQMPHDHIAYDMFLARIAEAQAALKALRNQT